METGFKRRFQTLQHLQTFVWLGDNSCHPAIQTSVNLTFFKKEYLFQFSTFSSHILLFLLIVPVSFNFHVFICQANNKIFDNL